MKGISSDLQEPVLRRLLIPFVLSVIFGSFIFYGNEAYQIMGLAALQNTIVIFGYALGIAEFLVLAVLVQRIVQLIILDRLIAKALGAPVPRLLSQMSSVIIYTLAIAAIVGVVFKKDLTVVMATFGGASIVVGLALQGMIRDLFAGLTINLDRSINIGDFICINRSPNIEGEVKEISWRTTQILDSKGNLIIVPNNQMSSSVVTNYSAPLPYFETEIILTLDVSIPVERVLPLLTIAASEAMPLFAPVNAPQPAVRVRAITLQGIEYQIVFFPTFKTRTRSKHFVQQQVLRHLHYAGLMPAREKCDQFDAGICQESSQHAQFHLANLLSVTPLFQDLDAAELQLLADVASRRYWPAATVVVSGGDMANFMMLVVEGLLVSEAWRKKVGNTPVSSDSILGPGCLVNSDVMLAGGNCPATIRAKTDVLLYEIDYAGIEKLFLQKPALAYSLSRRVAEQMIKALALEGISQFQNCPITDSDAMTAIIFKNLRRTYAHLKLT